ncbi:MAG: LPS assembly lipoprotein LptE [Lysobacter sp.]
MIRRLFPVVLVLALSACGFQLRNALTLPSDLGPVKVVSVDRYSPLAESLARALDRAGATAATVDSTDAAVLDLLAESWGDTPVSVDELGRSQEFSLRYAVIFELRKADGAVLVPRQTIELARDYVSNPVNSIGTEGEREILQHELRREMAAAVLRRIDAVTRDQGAVVMPAATPVSDTSTTTEAADASSAPAPR